MHQTTVALDIMDEVAQRWGLRVTWDKTEVVHMQPHRVTRVGSGTHIQLSSGQQVKVVPAVRHLGVHFNTDGDQLHEVRRRIAAAAYAFHKWSPTPPG